MRLYLNKISDFELLIPYFLSTSLFIQTMTINNIIFQTILYCTNIYTFFVSQ